MEELTEKCAQCGKRISDKEYVIHWTSCADCFDKGYEEYLKDHPIQPVDFDFGCTPVKETGKPV